MDEKINCFLKRNKGESVRRPKHVSGSDPRACSATPPIPTSTAKPVQEVSNEVEEPKYNENEINGKFKIMMAWNEEYNDPESEEYQNLANSIENDLEDMLRKERDLSEQVEDFTVKVQKLRRGSVVCDFKVNYILKEAYIAIPFAIKPSNITDSMSKNFKFKKGILFQRFLIAGGSFNASSPVDHCASKGCSHKCDYDYGIEDYVCTCPPSLVLGSDGLTCITEGEEDGPTTLYDGPRDEVTTSTTESAIELVTLPTNCLWGPWSSWDQCSVSCGKGVSKRTRTVAIPEKNGGTCNGEAEETAECSTNIECEKDDESTDNGEATTVKDDTTMAPEEDTDDMDSDMDENKDMTTKGPDAEMTTEAEEQAVDDRAVETGAAADSDMTTTDSSVTDSTSETGTSEEDTDAETDADTEISGDGEQTTSISVTDDGDTKIVYPTEIIDPVTTVASSDQEESTTPSGTESITDDDMVTDGATEGPEATTTAEVQYDDAGSDFGEMITEAPIDEITDVTTADNEKDVIQDDDQESTTKSDDIQTTTVMMDDMTATIEVIEDMLTTQTPGDSKLETTTAQVDMSSGITETEQAMESTTELDTSSQETEEMTTKMSETSEPNNEENATDDSIQAGTEPVTVDETSESMTSTQSSVDEMMTTSKNDNESIPDMSIDVPAEVTPEETSLDGMIDDLTTSLPLDTGATDANETVDGMTSTEVTTSVSEKSDESESETEANTMGMDDALVETTTASVNDGESTTSIQEDKPMEETTTSAQENESAEDRESTTVSQNEEPAEETTTSGEYDESVDPVVVSTPSGMDDETTPADMDIAPRMDVSQETTTSIIVEIPADTSVSNIDSDSLVTETTPASEDMETVTSIPLTTMRVISVEDEGDSVTVVTMRPTTDVTDSDIETSDSSDATTTMQPIMEDDPDQDISNDSQETTTASAKDQDTVSTTTSSTSQETTTSLDDDQEPSATDDAESTTQAEATTEVNDQNFLCTATDESVDASGDLPMSCKHMDGDEEKTIMLLIPKEILGDISLTRLFDKNVKIVVKDFMIMDRSPRRLL